MKLSQAARKLALTTAYGYDHTLNQWEELDFKISYPPDGRFIGRQVSFYDRRTLITPEEIPSRFSLLRLGLNSTEEVMIYAGQENINRDETYLYSYTVFNIMGYATVRRLTKTTTASGVGGKSVESVVGSYPLIVEKGFSGPGNDMAAGVYNTRVSGYMPLYADVKMSDTIHFGTDVFTIDEMFQELQLRYLQFTKR